MASTNAELLKNINMFIENFNKLMENVNEEENTEKQVKVTKSTKEVEKPVTRRKTTKKEAVPKPEKVKKTSASEAKKSEKVEINFMDTFDNAFIRGIVKENPILSREEVINLVSQYYDIQDLRISAGNRQYQLDKDEETDEDIEALETKKSSKADDKKNNISFSYANAGLKHIEETIARWLKAYAENDPIGRWLLNVKGIGPVLAAGFIAYIDISKCQTAGSIWKYAGWEGHRPPRKKGVKLDYNPKFRVLCWKAGESFQKVSGYKYVKDPKTGRYLLDADKNKIPVCDENGIPVYRIYDAIYGHIYNEKLQEYIAKNEIGGFAENAKLALSEKKFEKETKAKEIYESGKLPMSHMISMAKRYAVKIFLSHLFEVWYEYENGVPAPKPFVEAQLGHVHIIPAPNKHIVGLK